jgi:ATP/maltotriose-dependent transcriptional regulator MalT
MHDGGYLPRPRLESRLDAVMTRRLAVIVAGAGYGKSTLVGAWAADRPTAWCALDDGAAGLRAIAGRTIRAFRTIVPDLPNEVEMAVRWSSPDAADAGDDEVRAQAQAALLCEALATRLSEHAVLVIDDLHEIPVGSASLRFIDALVRGAPPTLHVVVTSRQPIPFAIQRLRGQGQIVEIGADRLRFDDEEAAALLARLEPPMPEAGADVTRVTEGWPALVRLVIESFRDEPPDDRARALERLVEPGGRLFDYLAEEVLDREPAATREVLRIAARFDQVDAAMLAGLGVTDADAVLAELTGRALFIESRRDAPRRTYSLHHLLSETVTDRWPMTADEVARLRGTAADWLEANGRPAEALVQRTAVPDPDGAATLLEAHGARWLQDGAFATIVDGMAGIPTDRRTPALDLLLGDACLRRGDWDLALEALWRAAGDQTALPAGIAWRIGLIQHERGDAVDALATFERADLGTGDPEDLALVAAWRATTYWQRSDPEGCRPWAEFALEAANRSGSDRALAAAMAATGAVASMDGDVGRTEDLFRQSVSLAERAGDVLIGARYRADLGYVLILEGRYADALTELDAAV